MQLWHKRDQTMEIYGSTFQATGKTWTMFWDKRADVSLTHSTLQNDWRKMDQVKSNRSVTAASIWGWVSPVSRRQYFPHNIYEVGINMEKYRMKVSKTGRLLYERCCNLNEICHHSSLITALMTLKQWNCVSMYNFTDFLVVRIL